MVDQRFAKSIVEIDLPTGTVTVGARGVINTVEVAHPSDGADSVHVITAYNPYGADQGAAANEEAQAALTAELDARGLTIWPARGGDVDWTHVEDSVAVLGLTDAEAVALGRRCGQLAVFAWRPDRFVLLDCADGHESAFALGGVRGGVRDLHTREDYAELTAWSHGPRLPMIRWPEIRDHLTARLMMDAERTVHADNGLTWWPTPLPMRIWVDAEYDLPDGDNLVMINAETDLTFTDDAQIGTALVAEYADRYPTGSLVYEDGHLRVCARLALTPLGRAMLIPFHESVLIQAAVALELAAEWRDVPGLSWAGDDARAHPTSGARDDVDELVRIYGGRFALADPDRERHTLAVWEHARPLLRENMVSRGWALGFSNDEVDFFQIPDNPLVEIAVGTDPEDRRTEAFGHGLIIWARLMPPGVAFGPEEANNIALMLLRESTCTLLGHVTGGDRDAEIARGSIVSGYLPFNPWAEYTSHPGRPADAAISIGNVLAHYGTLSSTFARWAGSLQNDEVEQGAEH